MAVIGFNSDQNKKDSESEALIPGLPDEVAELCLLHVPYPYQGLVRSVSSSWNKSITHPRFVLTRMSLSLSVPYLVVFAFHKPTGRIQWQAMDPRSGRWFVLPPMPCPKAVCPPAFACASIPRAGKLVVLGGMRSDTETPMDSTYVYSAWTNQWAEGAPMPSARSFLAAGCVGGRIVAVGGSDSITAVDCYDAERDEWRRAAEMRLGLARYESAVVGGKMWVTEGWTWPFMYSPRGGVYGEEGDTWREMGEGMKEGWTGVSVVMGDRLFVIAEYGDCPMKVYVEEEDAWRYVGGETLPRAARKRPLVANAVDGNIYVVASGLHVAVGRVYEEGKEEWTVHWDLIQPPKEFHDLSPSTCQLLYA